MDFGVIGAFALYSYGYLRATRDIDFITRLSHKTKVVVFLESLGFETLHSSNAFSNHLHPLGSVRVDMMYVDGETAREIFGAVEKRLIFEDLELPVISPEHLVAMKLFAVQSNPERKLKDLSDIKEILCRTKYNKIAVKAYFKKYGQESFYKEISGDPV
jgi:predicted nucleotidyltransferase